VPIVPAVRLALVAATPAVAQPPRADLPTWSVGDPCVCFELPELGHGIFTYYLVNGPKRAADLNRDAIVCLNDFHEYVGQQATMKARAVGGNQHPVMTGEIEGALSLVKVKK
jgi:hypothetical protein